MLSDALNHGLSHFKDDKSLQTIFSKLKANPQNESQFSKSALALNSANHNPDVFFNANEARETWSAIHSLMKHLLAGPPMREK